MSLRMPQILVAMTLVLVAGILSVHHLERRTGGPTVPGIVVLDAPSWGADDLSSLQASLGGRLGEVDAEDAVLAPFDRDLLQRLTSRGDATVLCPDEVGPELEALGYQDEATWEVSLPASGDGARAVVTAETFVRAQTTMRSFLVAILLGGTRPSAELLQTLGQSIERLPTYRRTALVVLGGLEPADGAAGPGRRPYLRIDHGDWGHRRRSALDDLLDPGW